ncbi:hypothetical protein ACFBZI_07700 [Moraxella sp. ZJ142]|uniref:hypothetical protein n=1 Tax=Moraxella marmotae TaxID=3344520 RepID=UPI0035D51A9F
MAIFKTYKADGSLLLDANLVKYGLIKSCGFEYRGDSASNPANILHDVVKGLFSHVFTVDVVSQNCPICFIHYDGTIYDSYGLINGGRDYNFVYPFKVLKGKNGYRFYFGSISADPRMLDKIRFYFFDAFMQRETKVGLNLYDQNGVLTFSTANPPLHICHSLVAYKPKASYIPKAIAYDRIDGSDGGAYLGQILQIAQVKQTQRREQLQIVHDYISQYLETGQVAGKPAVTHELKRYYFNNQHGVWGQAMDNSLDYVVKLLDKNRRYATYCTAESQIGTVDILGSFGRDLRTTTFSSMGINGAVLALACVKDVPLSTDRYVLRNGSRFDWLDKTTQAFPNILVADVTNLPFPYN